MIILGIIMTITVQLLGLISAQRRRADHRQIALAEVENALDRVTSLPWDQVDEARLASRDLDNGIKSRLPEGTLAVIVRPVDGPPVGKRVTVEARWRTRSGLPDAPVRLVGWVYRREWNR